MNAEPEVDNGRHAAPLHWLGDRGGLCPCICMHAPTIIGASSSNHGTGWDVLSSRGCCRKQGGGRRGAGARGQQPAAGRSVSERATKAEPFLKKLGRRSGAGKGGGEKHASAGREGGRNYSSHRIRIRMRCAEKAAPRRAQGVDESALLLVPLRVSIIADSPSTRARTVAASGASRPVQRHHRHARKSDAYKAAAAPQSLQQRYTTYANDGGVCA